MTEDTLSRVIRELMQLCKKNHIKLVLAGGIATGYWARPRATFDVDGVVEIPLEEAQNFLTLAARHGFTHKKKGGVKLIKGMPLLTLYYLKHKTYVDLFIASDDFQKQIFSRSKQAKLHEMKIPMISCEDLILLKLIAGRNKDMEDIRDILIENYARIDFRHLKKWAKKLGVEAFLKDELQSVKHELRMAEK